VKRYWEIIADNLSKAGWTCGCVASVTAEGRIIFVAAAHRGDGRRFVVHADEKLTAFMELESAIRAAPKLALRNRALATQFAPQGNQAERSESEQR
jgi:hypothetical protein